MFPILSWKNDPHLLEDQPDHTIYLNDLLEEEKKVPELLLTNPLADFYCILIKKREFIQNNTLLTRTRILPRMPYLLLDNYQFLKEGLVEKSWSLAETSRDYFYGSAMLDNSIKSWKQRVDRYTEKGAIPLPLLRGNEELWQQLTEQIQREKQIIIQSAKGEQSIIPLELTEKLVYLLGIIDGDGHLSKHQVHIVDYSKKQIEQLQRFFQELFGVTGDIRKGKDGNYYILLVNGKWIVRLVQFLTGHSLGRKYESLQEPLILKTDYWSHLRGAYWRGMFDADGSYRAKMEFVTISKKLSNDLKSYFLTTSIKFSFKEIKNAFKFYIPSGSRTKLYQQIGSWHPIKKSEFLTLLSRRYNGEEVTFLGINEQNMNPKGFFDFTLMDNRISIINSGAVIKQIREQKGFTRNEFAKLLAANYSTLASYENSGATPTIKTMIKVASIIEESLPAILQKYQLNKFAYILSVELPFSPTKELKKYLRYLYPRLHNVISLQTKEQETLHKIEEFFSIKIDKERGNDFKNYVLWDFLRLFVLYETEK